LRGVVRRQASVGGSGVGEGKVLPQQGRALQHALVRVTAVQRTRRRDADGVDVRNRGREGGGLVFSAPVPNVYTSSERRSGFRILDFGFRVGRVFTGFRVQASEY